MTRDEAIAAALEELLHRALKQYPLTGSDTRAMELHAFFQKRTGHRQPWTARELEERA
jgi:hypothetical protein